MSTGFGNTGNPAAILDMNWPCHLMRQSMITDNTNRAMAGPLDMLLSVSIDAEKDAATFLLPALTPAMVIATLLFVSARESSILGERVQVLHHLRLPLWDSLPMWWQ